MLTACSFLNMNKKCNNCHRCTSEVVYTHAALRLLYIYIVYSLACRPHQSCPAETFWFLSHEPCTSTFFTTNTGLWPRHPLWTPKFSSEVQDLLVWRLGGFHIVKVNMSQDAGWEADAKRIKDKWSGRNGEYRIHEHSMVHASTRYVRPCILLIFVNIIIYSTFYSNSSVIIDFDHEIKLVDINGVDYTGRWLWWCWVQSGQRTKDLI